MKLPRDLSAADLQKALKKLGYVPTRQTGSHLRLTTIEKGEHHLTIPNHTPLKIGTLSAILAEIGRHFEMDRESLNRKLFS